MMAVSPLRRLTGFAGLLALGVIGFMLVAGNLTIPEAATRAGVVLVAVVAVGRIVGHLVSAVASSTERQADPTHDRGGPTLP